MKRVAALAVAFVLGFGVALAAPGQAELRPQAPLSTTYMTESLNAVLWVQTAAEYRASALQAYAAASSMLVPALADPEWTALTEQAGTDFSDLPPAVILDVDETVLDNSPNQARQVLDDVEFSTPLWHEWVREEKAGPVPGALRFTRMAAQLGIRVFYVTNRRHEVEEPTRRNLERLGFPLEDGVDTLLTRDEQPDWGSDKGTRRRAVAAGHRVLLQVGDNLGDFVSGIDVDPAARDEIVSRHESYWGRRWIVLPNPQYGSWDGSLIEFRYGLDRAGKRALKLAALRPARESTDD